MTLSEKFSSTKTTDSNTSLQNQNKSGLLAPKVQKAAAYAIVAVLFAMILLTATNNLRYDLVLSERKMLTEALLTTLWISLVTLILSMICGLLFFLAMRSSNVFMKTLANILKEIVMGTPLLVMIFLVVYVFGIKVGLTQKSVLGIIALTAYMTPYIANAYETASAVVDKNQYTVMDLYHFNLYQRYRYIIIPQMITI